MPPFPLGGGPLGGPGGGADCPDDGAFCLGGGLEVFLFRKITSNIWLVHTCICRIMDNQSIFQFQQVHAEIRSKRGRFEEPGI